MAEPDDQDKLDELKKTAERHRTKMQNAWDQANITGAIQSVSQERLAEKQKRSESKSDPKPKPEDPEK